MEEGTRTGSHNRTEYEMGHTRRKQTRGGGGEKYNIDWKGLHGQILWGKKTGLGPVCKTGRKGEYQTLGLGGNKKSG